MGHEVVIFDLDGTLLDTIKDLGEAVNHSLSLRSLPLHSPEEYVPMVGHGIRNLVINALPPKYKEDSPFIDRALADFREYYSSHIDVHTRPYPGMKKLVGTLSSAGIALAVASNKFQAGAEHLIHEFFPGTGWLEILGNRPEAPLKPDAAIIRQIMESYERKDAKAIMVGDSATDILTAKNGGIPSVGVTWGYRPEADLSSADFIARSPEELEKILLFYDKKQ